ncbi:Rieske (2Fe-2S) protein [Austwickia chelonae]|uniref:Rieske (2Fe-2S) protein n=1 Tax=Austwickia chelonae TaxID=100225 RepID=UPI000E239887|nr:Rieske (2Fe-2S) protein [Austwickia chelonae]
MTATSSHTATAMSRRDMLRAGTTLTIAGATVTLLAGCGGKGGSTASTQPSAPSSLSSAATQKIAEAVKANKVEVGKAAVLGEGIILAQPESGNYVVFSDICPHQGARITDISSRGNLRCALHGSEFDPKDGKVKVGPANTGLVPRKATVDGDKVTLA